MDDLTPEEVEAQRAVYGPFAQAIRELVDAGIRTTVADDEVRRAQAEIEAITARLQSQPAPGRRTASGSAPTAAAGPGATPWSGCATPWRRR